MVVQQNRTKVDYVEIIVRYTKDMPPTSLSILMSALKRICKHYIPIIIVREEKIE